MSPREIRIRVLFAALLTLVLIPVKAIDSVEVVTIGGIRQWITLKGQNDSDPVLLFLHGGPGNSAMSYSDEFTGELRKRFVVVQWDQRATGQTKKLNPESGPLTVAIFESDAVEMINYLKQRFSKDKIYLMGHSWGGFLGLLVAAHHPELLEGYFAISPMVWQDESERQTLLIMKEKASGNPAWLRELNSITLPFATGKDLYFHRKGLAKLMGQKMYSQAFVEGWALQWLTVFREASAFDFFTAAPEIKCPVYFLVGGKDYQTYHKMTEQYFTELQAPRKELFRFPESAHTFFSAQQKKLQEIVLRQLPERTN